MGNNSSNISDEDGVGCGKLNIEKYPINISEDEWIPADFQKTSKQNKEVLISNNIDRRIRAQPEDYNVIEDEKQNDINIENERKIIKVIYHTVCVCGRQLERIRAETTVYCRRCGRESAKNAIIYHCPDDKTKSHENGYHLCFDCRNYKYVVFEDEKKNDTMDSRYCICGEWLKEEEYSHGCRCYLCQKAYFYRTVYHCPHGKTKMHKNGFYLCHECRNTTYDTDRYCDTDDCKNPIYNVVRLKMKYSDYYCFGSGVIIHHTLNKSFVLTAAHNIITADEHDTEILEYPQAIWVEINENTSNEGYKTLKRYNCSNYQVHASYIKYLQNAKVAASATGYDVAIIEVLDTQNELRKIKPLKLRLFKSAIPDNLEINIVGYPGEDHLRGQLYAMKGCGETGYINDKIKHNQLIIYDNIDTSKGQSGSPIFHYVNKSDNDVFKSFGKIVGVHVVGIKRKKKNYGTMLNNSILQWIHRSIDGDCNKYDNFSVGVLLITSSKSKYAHKLNQIHAKCLKTEIIGTRRLYYDYDKEDTVDKRDFLFYVKKMFDSDWKSYLIFYCGESDENGNWIINKNETDNVTLNDISQCARKKGANSKLYIVSDCNHSGNWVQAFKKRENNQFENIDEMQASSKPNEMCNAGAFTSKYAKCCFQWNTYTLPVKIAAAVGGFGVSGLSAATVGTIYDGAMKQTYHKATKQSQPTTTMQTDKKRIVFGNCLSWIGYSRDKKLAIVVCMYNSWYEMDYHMTILGGMTAGTANSIGFY